MTGLSRNTIAEWLDRQVAVDPKYRRGLQPNKLAVFHATAIQALKGRRVTAEARASYKQSAVP